MDFADGALQRVDALMIPPFQPMQLIKGDLAEIERQLRQFADYAGELPVWLDIEVATQDYLSDIQRRIQLLADELPVEVVLLRRSKEQRRQAIAQQDKETLNELSVNEVFERRLAQEAEMPETRQQRMRQMFCQVVEAVQHNAEETNS
ncbi:Nuclease sbcCD subunit D [Acinetobacter baumannii]|nr:Nuclease sbcCD subunit D [Acinetobacter baumannii]